MDGVLQYTLHWFLNTLSVLMGMLIMIYVNKPEKVREISDKLNKKLNTIVKGKDERVGAVQRPTQIDLIKKQFPQIEQGKKEFKKLLDNLPELKEVTDRRLK